jgi:hypothetical protein
MARGALTLAVAVFSACGGGLERVSFVTDGLSYARGERVGLELTNVSANAVGVNVCLSQLVSADGKTTGPSEAASCESLEPAPLAPGKSVTGRKLIPPGLTPGTWRYATSIRLGNGANEKILSPEFSVTP